jgi:hypothetical protein
MIVVKLYGGIGNQMFQYAAAKSLASRNADEFKLDISHYDIKELPNGLPYRSYDLSIFNIRGNIAGPKDLSRFRQAHTPFRRVLQKIDQILHPSTVYYEPHYHFSPGFFQLKGDVYLEGYWQSEKYFKEIEQEIRKDFTIRTSMGNEENEMLGKISANNSVCLNIRRKEFVTHPDIPFNGLEYIYTAADAIASKVNDPHFFIFSDEMQWCRENINLKYSHTFVPEHLYGDKFRNCLHLMRSCDHFIIPNSTFGWWAAWLGDHKGKQVVVAKKWFNNDKVSTKDLIPENWMQL